MRIEGGYKQQKIITATYTYYPPRYKLEKKD